MPATTFLGRLRALDVRIYAAAIAALLLFGGVMWVVPTTPDSRSFKFDSARRGPSSARPIELGKPIAGSLVDGSDVEFHRIGPFDRSMNLAVHLANGSKKMIPGLRVTDAADNVVQDKTDEFVRQPGANVDYSFQAQSGMTYYVQVFTQRNTTGSYTLTVSAREP
jgi:hypothetical protein